MPKTTDYNEIDLEKFQEYKDICTNTFWGKEVDVSSQLLTRYTKSGDTVLNLGFDLNSPFDNRKIITIDAFKQEMVQFIVAQPDHCSSADFDYKFLEKIKTVSDFLEQNRFLALVSGDWYFNSEIHLYGFKYADSLVQQGLKLKTVIVNEIGKNNSGVSYNLWKYRALNGGFNIINHRYIFIFQKSC